MGMQSAVRHQRIESARGGFEGLDTIGLMNEKRQMRHLILRVRH